jgi:Tfp pilus assembly protein PilF/S1-C subfamily serine protease
VDFLRRAGVAFGRIREPGSTLVSRSRSRAIPSPRASRLIVPALLSAALLAPHAAPAADPAVKPEDAVVLIRSQNSLRQARGSGFVIGDGSWIVTASHVVSIDLGKNRRAKDQTVLVYNPWTGRPYEARVVEVDGIADIAILRAVHPGFPALPLEGIDITDANVVKALFQNRAIHLFGFPLGYGEDAVAGLAKPESNASRLFEVTKRDTTNLLTLQSCPDAQPGWSGGPMVTDRGTVAAVFHSLYQPPDSKVGYPAGSPTGYLSALIKLVGASDMKPFLQPPAPTVPRPADAADRMARELRSMSWSAVANWKKAEEEQREIVRLHPQDAMGRVELGIILLAQKRDEEALKEMEAAVQIAPRSVLAHTYLGKALNYNFDPKGAITALGKALEIAPSEVEPRLVLADAYEAMRKPDEAEKVLRAALVEKPDHPALIYHLGNVLTRSKKVQEGLTLLAQAAELAMADPSLVFIITGQARALESAGKFKEAESRYRVALKQDPAYFEAHYYLAQLYLKDRRVEDAQVQLNVAINLQRLTDAQLRSLQALQVRINEKSGGS